MHLTLGLETVKVHSFKRFGPFLNQNTVLVGHGCHGCIFRNFNGHRDAANDYQKHATIKVSHKIISLVIYTGIPIKSTLITIPST